MKPTAVDRYDATKTVRGESNPVPRGIWSCDCHYEDASEKAEESACLLAPEDSSGGRPPCGQHWCYAENDPEGVVKLRDACR